MTGPIAQSDDPTQLAVARIRARVQGGRGLGTTRAERAHAQRDRNLLGALPAPLERELVAMTADLIRTTPSGPILERLRQRFAGLCTEWLPAAGTQPAARLTCPWIPDGSNT